MINSLNDIFDIFYPTECIRLFIIFLISTFLNKYKLFNRSKVFLASAIEIASSKKNLFSVNTKCLLKKYLAKSYFLKNFYKTYTQS